MADFLHKFFHNTTNDRSGSGSVVIPPDKKDWPAEWPEIDYKNYPLTPLRIQGSEDHASHLWSQLIRKRSSARARESGQKISCEQIFHMLRCGYGTLNLSVDERRAVPSAGSRYPLELYVGLNKETQGLGKGIYHYDVRGNALEWVTNINTTEADQFSLFSSYEFLSKKTGVIILTGCFSRMTNKYGDRGYRYILLEAGHVAQNILLAAVETGCDVLPVGSFNEQVIENILGIQGADERVIYGLYF